MDPKKDTNKSLFGGRFWHLFWSLGPPLGHFVALLSPLGPRGPKKEAQEQPEGGQEPTKSRPREAKRSPGVDQFLDNFFVQFSVSFGGNFRYLFVLFWGSVFRPPSGLLSGGFRGRLGP